MLHIFKMVAFGSILALVLAGCQKDIMEPQVSIDDLPGAKGGNPGKPGTESYGNNLSFPVVWSEGAELTLREPPGSGPQLQGSWWFVWGVDPIDPQAPIFSCQPNPDNTSTCIDQTDPGDGTSTVYKAWLQKDPDNVWQAYNAAATDDVNVDFIDWGDNLESIDWNLTSKVRTEVVLYENMAAPVLEYAMRHVSGWGTDELHGLQTTLDTLIQYGPGTQATVYSKHARLTIQKLATNPTTLTWNPTTHMWDGDANAPIFNKAVWEAGDGPGFYNAEVNVKGKIIYGYTWTVRQLNDGAGVYRITFSFDNNVTGSTLNTFFVDGTTSIIQPIEVEEEDGGGGTAILDYTNNLTYMDVTILARGGGGKPTN